MPKPSTTAIASRRLTSPVALTMPDSSCWRTVWRRRVSASSSTSRSSRGSAVKDWTSRIMLKRSWTRPLIRSTVSRCWRVAFRMGRRTSLATSTNTGAVVSDTSAHCQSCQNSEMVIVIATRTSWESWIRIMSKACWAAWTSEMTRATIAPVGRWEWKPRLRRWRWRKRR